MDARRTHAPRALPLAAGLCLAAVLALLVGGVVRTDLAAHHHHAAVFAVSVSASDNGPHSVRTDHPVAAAETAALVAAGLIFWRTANASALAQEPTAHTAPARGPPGQAL